MTSWKASYQLPSKSQVMTHYGSKWNQQKIWAKMWFSHVFLYILYVFYVFRDLPLQCSKFVLDFLRRFPTCFPCFSTFFHIVLYFFQMLGFFSTFFHVVLYFFHMFPCFSTFFHISLPEIQGFPPGLLVCRSTAGGLGLPSGAPALCRGDAAQGGRSLGSVMEVSMVIIIEV